MKAKKNLKTKLSKLSLDQLQILKAIGEEIAKNGQSVTSKFLEQIIPYQGPAINKALQTLCFVKPNPADFPFLIRQRRGKNSAFLYYLNPQITLNSIQLAINQKMGFPDKDQFVEPTSQTSEKQLILEKLEEIKTLVKANME